MLKFALDSNDKRTYIDETTSKFDYFCPYCGAPLSTKKGEVRQHHFAHKKNHACSDSWSGGYDISDWHYSWQNLFPKENREICLALGSVKHRADVLVGRTVAEFQKSALKQSQFNERNTFYHDLGYKVVWLFDMSNLFESGDIRLVQSRDGRDIYSWRNPQKAFNSYDLEAGNIDLFFQIREGEDAAIIQVVGSSEVGYEEFYAFPAISNDDFVAYICRSKDEVPKPDMRQLEAREDYAKFSKRYNIVLNAQQERAVIAVDGAVLLLAVPGSGKTTVLVSRLGYMVLERNIKPSRIIALTYTNAAVSDMKERFTATFGDENLTKQMNFSTINSLAKKIYEFWCSVKHENPRKLVKEGERKKALKDILRKTRGNNPTEGDVIELGTAISYIKNMMLSEEEILEAESALPGLSAMYDEYQKYLEDKNLMDFDDQLVFALKAIKEDGACAKKYKSQYDYWCVDEAQDTSKIQHEIVKELAGKNGNVFMVGDEDQSIYGFRAAYPKALLNFKYDYTNTFVLQMEKNYRSGKEIVSAANRFIERCKGRFDKTMVSVSNEDSTVELVELPARTDQLQEVLKRIKSSDGELAVLFRDNDSAVPLIDALLRQNIAFNLLSVKETFFDERTVRDVLAFLRLVVNNNDTGAFMEIYYKGWYIKKNDAEWACKNYKRKGIGLLDALIEQMWGFRKQSEIVKDVAKANHLKNTITEASGLAPAEAIEHFRRECYDKYLESNSFYSGKVDILQQLAASEETIEGFLLRVELLKLDLSEIKKGGKEHSLTLSTIHSCKGLEFDSVIIMDAYDGVLPTSKKNIFRTSKDESDVYQEERRLFYVAMTRAKTKLTLLRVGDAKTSFIDELFPQEEDERPTCITKQKSKQIQGSITVVLHAVDNAVPAERVRQEEKIANAHVECLVEETPVEEAKVEVDEEAVEAAEAAAEEARKAAEERERQAAGEKAGRERAAKNDEKKAEEKERIEKQGFLALPYASGAMPIVEGCPLHGKANAVSDCCFYSYSPHEQCPYFYNSYHWHIACKPEALTGDVFAK